MIMRKYEITRDQIIELALKSDKASIWLQQNFKDAFKLELEIGKWYKSLKPNGSVFEYIGDKEARGFFQGNDWTDSWCWPTTNDLIEADKSEVFELLKKEAIKRGYKNGNHKCLNSCITEQRVEDNYIFDNGYLWYGTNSSANCIFQKGKWAEIIPTITKSEAEKKLGIKIVD